MRHFTIILLTFLISCSTSKERNTGDDFRKYLNSLDNLEVPVTFDTKNDLKVKSRNYDTTLFQLFKHAWSMGPHGKIFEGDSIVVIVDITAGDVLVPLIMTFNQQGQKLDSLNPYDKAGADMGYESYEFVTINDNKEIVVTDSTRTWDLNADKSDIVEGSEKLTVDTVIYKIDKRGKIIKIKGGR
jgi:hypothetical protein